MSAAGIYVPCKCGHPRDWHPEDLDEQCTDRFCGCQEYIPNTLKLDAPRPATVSGAPVDEHDEDEDEQDSGSIVARGKRSHSKRTVSLAQKIEGLLSDLANRLVAESASAQVRAEIAKAEARLAELRAKLAGTPTPTVAAQSSRGPARGEYRCTAEGCDYVSVTAQGRAAHFRFNHKAAS